MSYARALRGYGQTTTEPFVVGGAFPEIYCPQDVQAGRPMTSVCRTYYAKNPGAPGAPVPTAIIWGLAGLGVLAALLFMRTR